MSTPPAGWYPDPQSPDDLRWYDGTGWTEHVTAATPVGASPVAVAATAGAFEPQQPVEQVAAPAAHGRQPGGQAWASAAPVVTAAQQAAQQQHSPAAGAWQQQRTWQGQVPTQGGPVAWPSTPPARRGLSTGLTVLVALGGVIALLVIAGIVASIAIPVYLNQRQAALLEPVRSTTCEEVATETIAISAQEVAASAEEQIPLVSLTETTLVEDRRGTVTAPSPGTEALVMVCEGTGVWADDFTSTVTVSLFVDATLETFQTVTWEE
ncbi:DUF2510 domain-containing protein [Actinotalea sp. BY-33]|uniref:DUF2510 domain-containing protein n=1 Tax=Actinotalea soli TaxID=2819234 RepID=A0A939LWZ4_9CELL|nr:DUF2510 domain-containing protein [Actinotalea soli]MBO1752792.1 DUF2510 domain-containing protein [Actinotalea soli]